MRRVVVAALLLGACQATEAPAPVTAGETAGVLETPPPCAVDDRAFVERTVLALWGRRPESSRELEVLAEALQTVDRAALVRAMTQSPEFRDRWAEVLQDLLAVNRFGERVNESCARRSAGDVSGALATHVRDNDPAGMPFGQPWTFTDLLHSALALDDLSPVFRAHLFAQTGSRVIDADDVDDEVSFRQMYASLFERSLINRRMDCLRCHNSEFSVVESHYPVPGHFERALYASSAGRADADLAAFFRVTGVLSLEFVPEAQGLDFWKYGEGTSPWGMDPDCGQFVPPGQIEPDPLGQTGWFIRDFGPTASIWDLERLLHAGFDALRASGMHVSDDLRVAGEPAFAWLVSMRVAEGVWEALTGYALTTPTNFPRNPWQRDLLYHLTDVFVREGFSLRELLVAALTHPYFQPAAPAGCPDLETPYVMAPVFDPWVVESEDPALRLNSVGDLVTRREPRVLLTAAAAALGWAPPDLLSLVPEDAGHHEGEEEPPEIAALAQLQTDLGLFVSDSETGFHGSNFRETLAWEEALGGCRAPWQPSDPAPEDFIDDVVAELADRPLEHALLTLKDRLLTEPTLDDPEERALLGALAGGDLGQPLGDLDDPGAALRRVCAALLSTPQFVLQGLPAAPVAASPDLPVIPGTERAVYCERLATWLPGFTCQPPT